METPVIEMKDVTVELGGEVILQDINLTVFHGETIVLIGQSGSGKTVLLKTMAGVYDPTDGHVLCYGNDWSSLGAVGKHDLAQKVGMQFQKSALFDSLTAFENVAFPIQEHGKTAKKELEDRVMECLASVSLVDARNLYPHEMSGGMRQRLGIARAIALKPEILFFDDPTAGLDPINSDQTADLILSLKKEINATLIIVTHDILRAYQMAGRILLVVEKSIVETGSAEQTKNHPDPRVQQYIHGSLDGPLKPI